MDDLDSGDWRKKRLSLRQKMVARFWGRDIAEFKNRGDFSDWLTEWNEEKPERASAWERYKFRWADEKIERTGRECSHETDATSRDLAKIEFGEGFSYLKSEDRLPTEKEVLEVLSSVDEAIRRHRQAQNAARFDDSLKGALAIFSAVLGAAFIIYLINRK